MSSSPSATRRVQGRLFLAAALFLCVYAVALSLAPAVRERTWQVTYHWEHWSGWFAWVLAAVLAHRQSSRWLPERDPYLLPVAMLLCGWGMLTVWRLWPAFGARQSLWMVISLGVLIAGLRLPSDLSFLRRFKYLWLTGSLILTALTLLWGTNPLGYGPRMWLGGYGVYFQPSEPLKLLLVVYLSAYLADRYPFLLLMNTSARSGRKFPTRLVEWLEKSSLLPLLAPTLIMTGLALFVLVVQRDLGTAFILFFLYAVVVYAAVGQWHVPAVAVLGTLAAGIVGYGLFDVVRVRVDAWLNPWLDPSGRSFQIVQSLLAVANGGMWGRGPGLGSPGLVPLAHSDLIFAAIAEEHGLVGSLGLLLLLALLAGRGLMIGLYAADAYRRYLAAGLTAFLVGQAVLIIGGNLRLAPLTGVTLPFVSYGGSSLLTSFLALLLLLHISNQRAARPATQPGALTFQYLGVLLLGSLAAAALVNGWWGMVRGPDLLTRTDNPRRAIADRYVRRGAILDRNDTPINITEGQPGAFVRRADYPALSNVVGYTDPTYGQSGLEASLDVYLRGLRGYSDLTIWWNHMLYGQPPPGLDVRLSLDLGLQSLADAALGQCRAALVLLDADSGEILAMASHPTFDANHLETDWPSLVQDPGAPLLNRATLGRYPVGALETGMFAALLPEVEADVAGWIGLPGGEAAQQEQAGPGYSPLQMALLAGVVSSGGVRPAPLLVTGYKTPDATWAPLVSLGAPRRLLGSQAVRDLALPAARPDLGIWETVAVIQEANGKGLTWYLGGTLPDFQGPGLALAVLLEEPDPALAMAIGEQLLGAALE
ncbi:MAG: FtsW/RodA/SpoVE family cell cycle protein [Chloroflexota bacterium]